MSLYIASVGAHLRVRPVLAEDEWKVLWDALESFMVRQAHHERELLARKGTIALYFWNKAWRKG